ncbi:MAG: hypothetical protein Tsb0020_18950 [Haliangiales bacterium]
MGRDRRRQTAPGPNTLAGVKVGARITTATSLLVTLTLGVYAFLSLRSAANERLDELQQETSRIALSIRASLEAIGVDQAFANSEALLEEINRAITPWRASLVVATARANAEGPAPLNPSAAADDAGGPAPAAGSISQAQLERLRTLEEMPRLQLVSQEGDRLIHVLPVRATSTRSPTGYRVAGSLEVARSVSFLDAALRGDIITTVPILAIVALVVVLASTWLTVSLMSRPIEKLLAGIDDVAQGDLSPVLLSERDDEIGALATRFNEMTYYLRESRAETQRQNQARLELEQRLRQTEKMATIGLFAAEIAHEVGTPLSVIAARARTLSKKADSPETVEKNADIISQQATRITRIIQRTLEHARQEVGTPAQVALDLNQLTERTLALHAANLEAAQIEHTLACHSELPVVSGDPDRLQQVVINLINNAVQAMPQGGSLRLSTHVVTRRRPGLERAPEQTYAVLEVADSGTGIAADERDKIFEPFYTSRRGEGGTGLGLSVCDSIVKDHDGWIHIDDAPEGGVMFRVYLPSAAANADDGKSAASADPDPAAQQ